MKFGHGSYLAQNRKNGRGRSRTIKQTLFQAPKLQFRTFLLCGPRQTGAPNVMAALPVAAHGRRVGECGGGVRAWATLVGKNRAGTNATPWAPSRSSRSGS